MPLASSAPPAHLPSHAIQDYLKTIFALERERMNSGESMCFVGTTVLAKRLDIAPASATDMAKKLAAMEFVRYERYRGIALTANGRRAALEVIRHHRLIELFLFRVLNVPWDKVHAEAEKLEHAISEELEDRIDELLQFPTTDPHGSPIPRRDGTMPNLDLDSRRMTLSELRAGHEAEIAEVSDHDSALLHDLGQLGMYPQVRVCVVAKAVFPGLLTVEIGGRKHRLRPDAARHIWVRNVRAIQPATKSNELKPRGRRATVK